MTRYITLVAMMLSLVVGSAFAQQFQVTIQVTDGPNTQPLVLGFDAAATDGNDVGIDVPAPPQGPAGVFDARLRNAGEDYFTDLRAADLSTENFEVRYAASSGATQNVTLNWNPADFAGLGSFTLTDAFGGTFVNVDMTVDNSFDVTSSPFTGSNLIITVAPAAPPALDADFSGTPLSGNAPLTVTFTNETILGGSALDSVVYSFGDGGNSTAQNPTKIYNTPGVYDVSLEVFDQGGNSDVETKTAYVSVFGDPTADFTANVTSGLAPLSVSFSDASTPSTGPGNTAIASYLWDFGDGNTSTSANPTNLYTSAGLYVVSLTVTDGNGNSDTRTINNFISANLDPAASLFSFPITVSDGANSQVLTIGLHPDATNDYDQGLDQFAPPAGPAGVFDARTTSNGDAFFTDFRAPAQGNVDFSVAYAAEDNQGPITLNWNPAALPTDFVLFIVDDLTGTQFGPLDMSSTNTLDVSSSTFLSSGLRIQVQPPVNIFATVVGPNLAGLTVNEGCPLILEIQVDMTNSPSPNDKLGSFTAVFDYPEGKIDYVAVSPVQSGFTGNVVVDESNGTITFNGARIDGADGVVTLLTVEFLVQDRNISNPVNANLSFSAMAAAGTFEDLLPKLGITNFSSNVTDRPLLGDVNADGLVNSTDALIILSFDASLSIPAAFQNRIDAGISDVNESGVTTATDALLILSYDVGNPVPAPVGQETCL